MPHGEVFLGGGAGELVPRADQLAVVAAVDAIADGVAQLDRDRTRELDGEIGDAAPRIEPIGGDDGAGGAGRQTGAAGPAMRGARGIERQLQAQVNLPDEEKRPGARVDEIGVFADPPEPGIARERLLENRRAVDEYAIAERGHPPGDA